MTSKRARATALSGVVLLALAGWTVLAQLSREGRTSGTPGLSKAGPGAVVVEEDSARVIEPPSADAPEPAAPAAGARVPASVAMEPDAAETIRGLVRVDAARPWQGPRLPQGETIRIELDVKTARGADERVVLDLDRELWTLEVKPGWARPVLARVVEVRWAGRPRTVLQPQGWTTFAHDVKQILVAAGDEVALEVVDAMNGVPLDDVTVRRSFSALGVHPGSLDARFVIATGVPSPVPLARRHMDIGIAAWSPGYAWRVQSPDELEAAGWRVELEGGGDVTVELVGSDAPADAEVRVRRAGERASIPGSFPIDGRSSVIVRGLRPGRYAASVERGEWYLPQVLAGPTEFDLAAAQEARIALRVSPAPDLPRAALVGEVVLEEGWDLPGFELFAVYRGVERTGDPTHVERASEDLQPRGPGRWRFEFADLVAGPYELVLIDPPYRQEVELPPAGRDDVEVRVPAPARIRVTTVDDATGDVVPVKLLSLRADDAALSGHGVRTDEPGRFEFSAPVGVSLRLSAHAAGYSMTGEVHVVRSGSQEITLAMFAGEIVYLRFKGSERGFLPIPPGWSPRDALDRAGRNALVRAERDEVGFRLYFAYLVDFELTPPPFPGYRPDPVTLRVEQGPARSWQVVRLEPAE